MKAPIASLASLRESKSKPSGRPNQAGGARAPALGGGARRETAIRRSLSGWGGHPAQRLAKVPRCTPSDVAPIIGADLATEGGAAWAKHLAACLAGGRAPAEYALAVRNARRRVVAAVTDFEATADG